MDKTIIVKTIFELFLIICSFFIIKEITGKISLSILSVLLVLLFKNIFLRNFKAATIACIALIPFFNSYKREINILIENTPNQLFIMIILNIVFVIIFLLTNFLITKYDRSYS